MKVVEEEEEERGERERSLADTATTTVEEEDWWKPHTLRQSKGFFFCVCVWCCQGERAKKMRLWSDESQERKWGERENLR